MTTWRRIEPDKHAWLRERNADPDFADDGEWERYYVPKGKRLWPLLALVVFPRWRTQEEIQTGRHRVSVAGSIKRGKNAWFEDSYGIPTELLDDVAEMFAKVIAKAKKGETDRAAE